MDANSATLWLPKQNSSLSFPYHKLSMLPLMIVCPSDMELGSYYSFVCTMDTLATQLYASAWSSQDTDLSAPSKAGILLHSTSSAALLSAIHDKHFNANLTTNQLELLAWHWKLNHLNMSAVQLPLRSEVRW
eukprot:11930281-Ditylum_brightwellii.AAC.1